MNICVIVDTALGQAIADLFSSDDHELCAVGLSDEDMPMAVAAADVVILTATASDRTEAILRARPELANKVVLDLSASAGNDRDVVAWGGRSFAERLASAIPTIRLVKTSSTLSPESLRRVFRDGVSYFRGQPLTMFYCSDDAAAKRIAAGLLGEMKIDPIDVGPLSSARLLEPIGALYNRLSSLTGPRRYLAINAIYEANDGSPLDAWM
jgi:8-hydroxy-5-deazaflavin:NADPH oxidoreductase